jgi:hypothetical protein
VLPHALADRLQGLKTSGVNGGGKPGHMPVPESASSGRCFLTVGIG